MKHLKLNLIANTLALILEHEPNYECKNPNAIQCNGAVYIHKYRETNRWINDWTNLKSVKYLRWTEISSDQSVSVEFQLYQGSVHMRMEGQGGSNAKYCRYSVEQVGQIGINVSEFTLKHNLLDISAC